VILQDSIFSVCPFKISLLSVASIYFVAAMIFGSLVAAILLPFGFCSNEITNSETGVTLLASGSASMTYYSSYPSCCCKSLLAIHELSTQLTCFFHR
jgi:hypothetical protein